MPRIAFLTMDSLDDFVTYDHLLEGPLAERGWTVEMVSWRANGVDWGAFAAVVIRTPWDYQQDPARFVGVLETIERAGARLANPLSVVRWNLDKSYLRELEAADVPIVPTRWGRGLTAAALDGAFAAFGTDQVVVKPTVGANADDAFWLLRGQDTALAEATFTDRGYLLQPFVPAVVAEGEFSLFYFGGAYSHAILKTPRAGDFRVQEEHGGLLRTVTPEPILRVAAARALAAAPPDVLYARVDLVRLPDGSFALMELELIEPSLYFPYDAASPARFADAFVQWMR